MHDKHSGPIDELYTKRLLCGDRIDDMLLIIRPNLPLFFFRPIFQATAIATFETKFALTNIWPDLFREKNCDFNQHDDLERLKTVKNTKSWKPHNSYCVTVFYRMGSVARLEHNVLNKDEFFSE